MGKTGKPSSQGASGEFKQPHQKRDTGSLQVQRQSQSHDAQTKESNNAPGKPKHDSAAQQPQGDNAAGAETGKTKKPRLARRVRGCRAGRLHHLRRLCAMEASAKREKERAENEQNAASAAQNQNAKLPVAASPATTFPQPGNSSTSAARPKAVAQPLSHAPATTAAQTPASGTGTCGSRFRGAITTGLSRYALFAPSAEMSDPVTSSTANSIPQIGMRVTNFAPEPRNLRPAPLTGDADTNCAPGSTHRRRTHELCARLHSQATHTRIVRLAFSAILRFLSSC